MAVGVDFTLEQQTRVSSGKKEVGMVRKLWL